MFHWYLHPAAFANLYTNRSCTTSTASIQFGSTEGAGPAFEWVGMAKERHDIRLQRLIEDCRKIGVPVRFLQRTELDRMAGNAAHQGVVAVTSAKQYNDLNDVIASKRGQYSLLVVLDGVEDPHNLGAILRTADAADAMESGFPSGARLRSPEPLLRRQQAKRTSADCEGHEHRAHGGRAQRKQHMDRRSRRARHENLRRSGLQHGLRSGAWWRRQGSARPGQA